MTIHPRSQHLKDRILDAPYEICIERARYVTESYRQTEGQPPALRAARAFAHTAQQMSLHILEDERIVGNRSSRLLGAVIPVERGEINAILELELDFLTAREQQPFRITADDRKELLGQILPYWKGRTLRDRKNRLLRDSGLFFTPALDPRSLLRRYRGLDLKRIAELTKVPRPGPLYAIRGLTALLYNNPALVMNVFDVQGHLILGHRNILAEGFSGVRERASERLEQARRQGDQDGQHFLEAVIISCEAMRDLAARFAEHAEAAARTSHDEDRKQELTRIAERCRRVPYLPPRDFREALQALWLTQVGALVAHGMPAIFAVGRIDQYLYPFYQADRDAGRIDDDEVLALLEELLLKLGSNLMLIPFVGKRTANELGSDSAAPTIGGVTREGEDAVNELSHLILDAFANVKAMGNSFTIRLSDKTSPEFWRKALRVFRTTSGAALFNDEICVAALQGSGYSIEDARDYGVIGCVEPTGDGDTFGCTSGNDISLTAALEMTLLDGYLRIMGKRIGPRSGDPRGFPDFERFLESYEQQIVFMVDVIARAANLKDQAYCEQLPSPLISATLRGCVEHARDATAGGARYNFGSIGARGMGTAVNSLAAVKHFVYETRTISMDQLIRTLESNFEGEERLRRRLASRGPKYGCDDDRADAIAKRVTAFFCRTVSARRTVRGGPFRPGFFSYGMHVLEGALLGATPDGRRAGEPVSNSFSPSNGSERQGPTAVLRSVAKVDHTQIGNGCALNVKFLPALLQGKERLDKMVALVRGYFALGGMELSPNVVSNETLRAAQRDPEQYRDLVIRVSGYSAFFTDLGQPLQDEIINRTEFGSL